MTEQGFLYHKERKVLHSFRSVVGLALLMAVVPAQADHWPQFRGPNGDGLTTEKNLPSTWSSEKNVRWKVAIPGEGWSAPVVWGKRVFITTSILEKQLAPDAPTARGEARKPPNAIYRWEVHCLDQETGKTLWKQVALKAKPRLGKHRDNTFASETPVTDGRHVYAYFGMMGVFCYDMDGKLVWKRDLGAYTMQAGWGTSSSPVLYKDSLIVQVDSEDQSFIVALDTKTGKDRWRVKREEVSTYGSPIIWKNNKRTELVTPGLIVRSYDPSTGNLLWKLDAGGGRASSAPVVSGDTLFVGTEDRSTSTYRRKGNGPGGNLFAVKAGASGDITPAKGKSSSEGVMWSRKKAGPDMASPLVVDGKVYVLARRRGTISCYNAKTGEPVYQSQRLAGAKGFWASPWAYDGKIFCLSAGGTTFVVKPGKTPEILSKNVVNERAWACPAIANGELLLRSDGYLYCIKAE